MQHVPVHVRRVHSLPGMGIAPCMGGSDNLQMFGRCIRQIAPMDVTPAGFVHCR